MTAWLDTWIVWITAHPHLAYLAVFLLALSESIPLIGVFVPGTAVILAVSALVPGGALQLWPLLAAAFAGAVVGDGLPFWVGHRHRESLLTRWPLQGYPQLVARSRRFVERHGDKSVFLARFTPGVRAFVPLFAGILRMPVRRFYVANIFSAAVWAPTHVLPGVLAGASFSHLGRAAMPAAALLVVLVLLLWATTKAVRFIAAGAAPVVVAGMGRLSSATGRSESRIGRFISSLVDPTRAVATSLFTLGTLLIASAWLFLGTLEDVVANDPLVALDGSLYRALQDLRTAPGDAVMIAITELGDASVVVAVALAVLAWLLVRRAWRTGVYWAAAILGASLLNTVIKAVLHRPRPGEGLYDAASTGATAFSFPSGHSTVNTVLYGFLALLIMRDLRPAARAPLLFGVTTIVLLIAFSRLYLGAHWLSDVAGGAAFGVAWLSILGVYWLHGRRENIGAGGMLGVAMATLVVAGGLHVKRQHAADVTTYAVAPSERTLGANEWRDSGWRLQSVVRTDITGETEEPLTIQWVGSIDGFEHRLQPDGWSRAPRWGLATSARWLSAHSTPADLPVVPALNAGRLPDLTLVGPPDSNGPPDTRRVLRLWPADLEIVDASVGSSDPLWLGSIVEEHLYRPASLFTIAWTSGSGGAGLATLADRLPNARLVARSEAIQPESSKALVLLASERPR